MNDSDDSGLVTHDDADKVRRFVFERLSVRGQLVDLTAAWKAALATRPYDGTVRETLGQAMGAVALLASSLKFDGRMTLQITGDGPLRMLVIQCRNELSLRAMAHAEESAGSTEHFHELVRDGRLVLSIEAADGQRYQGIVALERPTFVACLENYFANSEQLPTRLWLQADGERVSGLLLQKMPLEEHAPETAVAEAEEHWRRVQTLVDSASQAQLREPDDIELLRQLFPHDDVRLFDPSPVRFHCGCSRERIERVLLMMGPQEVAASMGETGSLTVSCEFCGHGYEFDAQYAKRLFEEQGNGDEGAFGPPGSGGDITLH